MKVGFLGTGLMGAPMVMRLLDAGHDVIAYNRTASKLDPLRMAGATVADAPKDAIQSSDVVITMVTNAEATATLVLSDDAKSALSGRSLIQMSTIAPQQSRDLCKHIVAAGATYLEAPVLGSVPQAKDGKLIVMVGATPDQFATWMDVFKIFGPEPMLVGNVGKATALKLAMNQLIGSLTTAFSLSLGFVQKEGIDVEQFMTVLRQSALYAPTFDKKLQRMVERDFADPNFPSKHLLKDINLFTNEAKTLGLDTSLTESVSQVVKQAIDMGLADEDYSSLFSAVYPPR